MRFGTRVVVTRGGRAPSGTPGCTRTVRGVLVGARGHMRLVRLLEDDPLDTVGWNRAGMVGRWSASDVEPEKATPAQLAAMMRRERLMRIAEALGMTPPEGGYGLRLEHGQGKRWWLCGCAEGDAVLPRSERVPTEDEALEAAEAWLAPEGDGDGNQR